MNVKRIAIATTIGLLCGAILGAIVHFAIGIPAFERGTSALIMVSFGVRSVRNHCGLHGNQVFVNQSDKYQKQIAISIS
jgi:ABC-type branched-subunit amino acid transport system permease subunit